MEKNYCHSSPLDFRRKINSVLLDEEDNFDKELGIENFTNPSSSLNPRYLHYVHLRNGKKSKAVI